MKFSKHVNLDYRFQFLGRLSCDNWRMVKPKSWIAGVGIVILLFINEKTNSVHVKGTLLEIEIVGLLVYWILCKSWNYRKGEPYIFSPLSPSAQRKLGLLLVVVVFLSQALPLQRGGTRSASFAAGWSWITLGGTTAKYLLEAHGAPDYCSNTWASFPSSSGNSNLAVNKVEWINGCNAALEAARTAMSTVTIPEMPPLANQVP